MKKKIVKIYILALLALPSLTLAQGGRPSAGYITDLIREATVVVRSLLVFLIALAVVWFVWNVIRYAMSEDEGGKEKAKSQMIWGIVSLAVIISIWGLVGILQNMFGLRNTPGIPQADFESMIPISR